MRDFIERHKLGVILLMMFFQCLSLALDTHSLYDRHNLKLGRAENLRLINELKHKLEMDRKMLDARARAQTTSIRALKRLNAYTPEEEKQFAVDWDLAEYNLVTVNPFLGAK